MNMKALIEVLLYIWQLPQNLLGLLLFWWYGRGCKSSKGNYVTYWIMYSEKMHGGISLGRYIVIPYHYLRSTSSSYVQKTIHHEYGHTRQSLYLGWLYLLIIGLPSITWAWLHSSFKRFSTVSYYDFYTERWADELGGVKR